MREGSQWEVRLTTLSTIPLSSCPPSLRQAQDRPGQEGGINIYLGDTPRPQTKGLRPSVHLALLMLLSGCYLSLVDDGAGPLI